MNRGWELATNEVIPRSLTEMPPPGAPELAEMFAPVNLPYNAPSSVDCWAPPTSSFDETEETAFATLLLFTEVAKPVTTTSLILELSMVSTIVTLLVAATVWDTYPTKLTTSFGFVPVTVSENFPS